MSSLLGCIGARYVRSILIDTLVHLESHSARVVGLACINPSNGRILLAHSSSGLNELSCSIAEPCIDGYSGIAYSSLLVSPGMGDKNVSILSDCQKVVAVSYNGVIENYYQLRQMLEVSGHVFFSDVEAEVVSHLIETFLVTHKSLTTACVMALTYVTGAYAFIALVQSHPDYLLVVRHRSPLFIGIGADYMLLASDPTAFTGRVQQFFLMPDESFALVKKDSIELFDFNGNLLTKELERLTSDGHDHTADFVSLKHHGMIKDTYDQKVAIQSTVIFMRTVSDLIWDHVGLSRLQVKGLAAIHLIGAGTSWHTAQIAQFFFESLCGIPSYAHLASEFSARPFFRQPNHVYIFISNSGETTDTLEALRIVTEYNQPTIALTNVASSTLVREADGFLLTQAGTASTPTLTKAFSTQITALYWFAHCIAVEMEKIGKDLLKRAEADLLIAAEIIENSIQKYSFLRTYSFMDRYAFTNRALFIGRHIGYPFALQAALKLTEMSAVVALAYPAGHLKQGIIGLSDERFPIILFSHEDPTIYQQLVVDAQSIKAHNKFLIVFAFEGQIELCMLADTVFFVPKLNPLLAPLVMSGLMHFLVYYIALQRRLVPYTVEKFVATD